MGQRRSFPRFKPANQKHIALPLAFKLRAYAVIFWIKFKTIPFRQQAVSVFEIFLVAEHVNLISVRMGLVFDNRRLQLLHFALPSSICCCRYLITTVGTSLSVFHR